jgi:hypothetical protein
MATLISRLEGSPPPRRREMPLNMRSGVDSHPTTHSHETGGVRHSAPSHMGQSPFSSVSSMSIDTTSPNTPVFGSAPASDHGDLSPNRRLPPPQWGRSTSEGSTMMVNPRPSQSPLQVGGSQPQTLGSTTHITQVGDNPSETTESSIEPTI